MILDFVFFFLCVVSVICVFVLRKEKFFRRHFAWYLILMVVMGFLMVKFTIFPYKYVVCKIISISLWGVGAIGICTDKFENVTAKNSLLLVIISLFGNFSIGYFC